MAAPPGLECGVAPLGPPAPPQLLLGRGVTLLAAAPALGMGSLATLELYQVTDESGPGLLQSTWLQRVGHD